MLLGTAILITACQNPTPQPTSLPTPVAFTPSKTPTLAAPTPVPEPLVAQVNGDGITMGEFEAELGRLQASQAGLEPAMTLEEQRQTVFDELVGLILLAQAAQEDGFSLDVDALDDRLDALAAKMGGGDTLTQWQTSHGYTPETFKASLARQAAADWMVEKIASSVPATAEQVHARQILVFDQDSAETVLSRLNSGTEFATLAYKYDAVTGGDLGWFPRGFLTAPEVEEAAFALEPGKVSSIIRSSVGYHIIMVIEKDSQKPLSPDALLVMQRKTVEDWITSRKQESQVVILQP